MGLLFAINLVAKLIFTPIQFGMRNTGEGVLLLLRSLFLAHPAGAEISLKHHFTLCIEQAPTVARFQPAPERAKG